MDVSTDDGSTWETVWTQSGTNSSGELAFVSHSISLAAYANLEIQVRFSYSFDPSHTIFPQTTAGIGFYVDNIVLADCDDVTSIVSGPLQTGTTFTLRPAVPARYILKVRGIIGGRVLPWGPMFFTASPILTVKPTNVPVPATAGSTTFAVSNTGGGTMSYSTGDPSDSWLKVSSGGTGGDSGTITVSYDANTGAQRSAVIQVTANSSSGSPQTLIVTQAGIPTVTVTAPNGGETWGGVAHMVNWSVSGDLSQIDNFMVSYSLDGGNTWLNDIDAAAASDRSIAWTPPLVISPGATGRIRVLARDGSNKLIAQDFSDGIFTFESSRVLILGIDASHHQGNVDWSSVAVAPSNRSFAFIKASEGTGYSDEKFPANMSAAAIHLNKNISGYHYADPEKYVERKSKPLLPFTDPTNPASVIADAEAEAEQFFSVAKAYLKAPYLQPALDLENDSKIVNGVYLRYQGGFNTTGSILDGAPHWTWSEIASWVNAWTKKLQEKALQNGVTGIKPILYMTRTYAAGLARHLANDGNYQLWIAAHTSSTTPFTPQNYTIPGTSYSWSPSIWPWAIAQYNTQSSNSPPGDWDWLNPTLSGGLDSLKIKQSNIDSLNISTTALALPATTQGTAGFTTNFTVSRSGLSSSNMVTLTVPVGVEVSLSAASGFASTLVLYPDAGGTLLPTTVYARIQASATANISGTLTVQDALNSSLNKSIPVSGALLVHQPDLWIGTSRTNLIGDTDYDFNATGQTFESSLARGGTKTYIIKVENDGQETNSFKVRSYGRKPGFVVRFFDNGVNITEQMTSTEGYRVNRLAPGEFRYLKIRVTALSTARINALFSYRLDVYYVRDALIRDAVLLNVRAR